MNVESLSGRILLDTNVLIYATLSNDPRNKNSKTTLF